ncbi:MAG: YfhO family protein [Clostridium sp.]|nr:YfhO family protein [Clostridium sp.]
MPVFLPVILVYLTMGRGSISYPVPLLYEPITYFVNFLDLFYNFDGGCLGYSLLFLPVLVLIFRKNTHWIYKVVVFIMALFICLPFLGSVMNGFSYVTDRCQFGMAFAAAYLISRFFENIYELSRREKMFAAIVTIVLILLAGIIVDDKKVFLCIVICSVGIILFLCGADRFGRVTKVGVPFLALVSIVLISNLQYCADNTNDSIVNYLGRGSAMEAYQGSLTGTFICYASNHRKVYENVAGDGAARFAQTEPYEFSAMNSALLTGIHGMQFYFSLYNDAVAEFNRSLAINAINDFQYSGVESRSILLHLLNAKYLLVKDGEEVDGFEPVSDGEGRILQSTIESRIGYTYQRTLTLEEWEQMNAVERQYAMLQAAVIDERDAAQNIPVLSIQELSQTYKELEYVCRAGEGIGVSDREWNVTDTGEILKISIGGWPNELRDVLESGAELYVVLEGIDYAGDANNVTIDISSGNRSSQLNYLTPKSAVYTGRHDFVCSLGLIKENVEEIQITFNNEGIYSFENMRIICQPLNDVDAYYDARYEDTFEEVKIGTNRIQGKISVHDDRLFVLTVPYSVGFCAYVDGRRVAILKVNEMMMGINLTAGEHEIVFCYRTPGLRIGWLLCMCGLILCTRINLYRKRGKNKLFSG